jgi:hypothetical protein
VVQAPKAPPPPKQPTPAVPARPKEQVERVLFTILVDAEVFHTYMPEKISIAGIRDAVRVLCNTTQGLTLAVSKPSERYFRFSTLRPVQKMDPNVPCVEVICRVNSPYSKETTMRRLVVRFDTDEDEMRMIAQEACGCRLDPLFDTFVSPADNVEYLFEMDP